MRKNRPIYPTKELLEESNPVMEVYEKLEKTLIAVSNSSGEDLISTMGEEFMLKWACLLHVQSELNKKNQDELKKCIFSLKKTPKNENSKSI